MADASASNKSHVNSNSLNDPLPDFTSDRIKMEDILAGAHGLAFPYKGFMYKVFFNSYNFHKEYVSNIQKKVNDALTVSTYLKNDRIKTSKQYEIPFSKLPNIVQQKYEEKIHTKPSSVLIVRMHMLGTDLLDYSNKFLDMKEMKPFWSIEQLFQLCIKCCYDNYCLYKNNYTHGDVDFTNIVCDTSSAVNKTDASLPDLPLLCRVIDFDHFGTRELIFKKIFDMLYQHFKRDSNITHLTRYPPIILYIFYNNKNQYYQVLDSYSNAFIEQYERFLPKDKQRSKEQIENEINNTMQNIEDTSINYDIDTFSYGNILRISLYIFLHNSDWTDSRIVELYTIIEQMTSFSQSERITPHMAFLLIVECANKNKISLSFIPEIQEKIQLEYDEAKLQPEEDKNREKDGSIKILREYRTKIHEDGYEKFKEFFEMQYQMRRKKDRNTKHMFQCVIHILYEIYRNDKEFDTYAMDVNKEYADDKYVFEYMDRIFMNDVIYGFYTKKELEKIYGTDIWMIVDSYTAYKNYSITLERTNPMIWFRLTILLSMENLYNNPTISKDELGDILTFLNSNIQNIPKIFPENEQRLYLGISYYIYFLIYKITNNIPHQISSLTYSSNYGCVISQIELGNLSTNNGDKMRWLMIAKQRLDMIPSYMLTNSYKKREIIEIKKNKISNDIEKLRKTSNDINSASTSASSTVKGLGGRRTHRKKRELRKRTLHKKRKNRTKRRA